jgi:hypothetical protein
MALGHSLFEVDITRARHRVSSPPCTPTSIEHKRFGNKREFGIVVERSKSDLLERAETHGSDRRVCGLIDIADMKLS